jgi:hypothetical protein
MRGPAGIAKTWNFTCVFYCIPALIRPYIKNVVFPLTLWKKNRVGNKFYFFLNFIFNWSEYIANSNTVMRIFIELKKGFISCIHIASEHTCRTAHLFALVANTKICSIFLEQIRFFWRGSIKFLGSGLKFRVGQVSGNTTFFFLGLILLEYKSWTQSLVGDGGTYPTG